MQFIFMSYLIKHSLTFWTAVCLNLLKKYSKPCKGFHKRTTKNFIWWNWEGKSRVFSGLNHMNIKERPIRILILILFFILKVTQLWFLIENKTKRQKNNKYERNRQGTKSYFWIPQRKNVLHKFVQFLKCFLTVFFASYRFSKESMI